MAIIVQDGGYDGGTKKIFVGFQLFPYFITFLCAVKFAQLLVARAWNALETNVYDRPDLEDYY